MADAAAADPLWDEWAAPPIVPGSPELHLDGFDGPMDLLLDLAERQRIDLGRISVLQLAEQFLAAMGRLQRHVALERRADWLVVATRLLLLRSRLLFPLSPEAEAAAAQDADREARRLDDMTFVRAAATWLDGCSQLGRDVFTRPHGRSPRVASYMALLEACLTVLRGREGQPGVAEAVYRPAPATLFRVDEAMARIRALMAGRGGEEVDFVHCLPSIRTDDPLRELKARSAVASSLVAVLELARGGEFVAAQATPQAPILLKAPPEPNHS
jgi:segregation and condensation protein A